MWGDVVVLKTQQEGKEKNLNEIKNMINFK